VIGHSPNAVVSAMAVFVATTLVREPQAPGRA